MFVIVPHPDDDTQELRIPLNSEDDTNELVDASKKAIFVKTRADIEEMEKIDPRYGLAPVLRKSARRSMLAGDLKREVGLRYSSMDYDTMYKFIMEYAQYKRVEHDEAKNKGKKIRGTGASIAKHKAKRAEGAD